MFLLVDKPKGMTSHDVVDEIRKVTGEKKIGHAGTLDPNATGLLIVGVGRESTKKLSKFMGLKKTYEAEIVLGEERTTDDVEGNKLQTSKAKSSDKTIINRRKVQPTLQSFVGEQDQTPPAYSAIKIKGKKAYDLARKGKEVKLRSRRIIIHSIKLINYNYPIIKIKTTVSSGTYIRALARDIGRKLNLGAYLKNLRRTSIGQFTVNKALTLDELDKSNWKKHIIET